MIKISEIKGIRKLVRWYAGKVVFVSKESEEIGFKENDKLTVHLREDMKTKEKFLVIKKLIP